MFEEKILIINNYKIKVIVKDVQARNTFIFVHGFNSSKNFIDAFEKKNIMFNIVAFSFPGTQDTPIGSGKISKDFLTKIAQGVIKKVKHSRKFLVGHSLGALITMNAADKKIKGIKLVSPFHPLIQDHKTFKMLQKLVTPQTNFSKVTSSLIKKALLLANRFSTKEISAFIDEDGDWYSILINDFNNQKLYHDLDLLIKRYLNIIDVMIGDNDYVVSTELVVKYFKNLNKDVKVVSADHSPFKENVDDSLKFLNKNLVYKKRFFPKLRKILVS